MTVESMSTKQGAWVKPGNKSGRANFPGSFGDYIYMRAPPSDYAKTAQQKKIGKTGQLVKENCEGKTGNDFIACVRNQYEKA